MVHERELEFLHSEVSRVVLPLIKLNVVTTHVFVEHAHAHDIEYTLAILPNDQEKECSNSSIAWMRTSNALNCDQMNGIRRQLLAEALGAAYNWLHTPDKDLLMKNHRKMVISRGKPPPLPPSLAQSVNNRYLSEEHTRAQPLCSPTLQHTLIRLLRCTAHDCGLKIYPGCFVRVVDILTRSKLSLGCHELESFQHCNEVDIQQCVDMSANKVLEIKTDKRGMLFVRSKQGHEGTMMQHAQFNELYEEMMAYTHHMHHDRVTS